VIGAAGRFHLIRMQNQLLDPPVEDFRDVENVLGGTGDLVNPTELLWLFARLAEHTQDLAIERELIDAARTRIGAVEHLLPVMTRRGDAQCPRGPWAEGAAV